MRFAGLEGLKVLKESFVPAPPSSVSISSAAAAVSTNVFEVEESTQLLLSCDVTGARPAASVQWQRNGENLDAGERDGRTL